MLEGRHGGLVGTKVLGSVSDVGVVCIPVADFLARALACSLPIILAWDFTFKSGWAMVIGGLLWQWIEGHLIGCGGDGDSGVRAAF